MDHNMDQNVDQPEEDEPPTYVFCGIDARVPGATFDNCAHCGCDIVVAPSSRQMAALYPDLKFLCMGCGGKVMAKDDDARVTIHPLQEPELHDALDEAGKKLLESFKLFKKST